MNLFKISLLVLIIIACIAVVGVYGFSQNKSSPLDENQDNTANPTENTNSSVSQQPYLVIKELGVRFKLTSNIVDAYYLVKPDATTNDKPVIALYLRSLDKYPGCSPTSTANGVAVIATFRPGQSDPVVGDYSTVYPEAPFIGGLHYYINSAQYDCSDGQEPKMNSIRQEFQVSYSTIELYPQD